MGSVVQSVFGGKLFDIGCTALSAVTLYTIPAYQGNMGDKSMSDRSIEGEGPALVSLEIDPGSLEFDPKVTEYTVQLEENVSKMLIKAKASEGASYTVSGNSALARGHNEVRITVKDQDGRQTVYRIFAVVGEEESSASSSEEEVMTAAVKETSLSFTQHIMTGTNRYVTAGIGGCALLAVILWCVFAVKRMRVKRYEKQLAVQREQERKHRQARYEQAKQQEEELLRQIDRLKEKSRAYVRENRDGLRVIDLDDEEDDDDWSDGIER